MHILIAPNAFKNALDAEEVALHIQSGLLDSMLDCTCERFPVGDGGNGTCKLIVGRLQGEYVSTSVEDPLGRPISASFGWIGPQQTAVVEMADASGLHLLKEDELDPLHATSYGTGQLIKAALQKGAHKLIIGMGGSATVDGGSGILAALGVRFLDGDGKAITDLPLGLERLQTIDLSTLDRRLASCGISVLCDVDNPLLGPSGAANVFGPQKGASPAMIKRLEAILNHYAEILHVSTGIDVAHVRSGGVAGGASIALKAIGADLVDGIGYYLELTDFDQAMAKCDLVITAEGSIDEQTLQGKGPFGVAQKAKSKNIPVIGLAGKIPLEDLSALKRYFDVLMPIGNGPTTLEEALAATPQNLKRTAMQIANSLSLSLPR